MNRNAHPSAAAGISDRETDWTVEKAPEAADFLKAMAQDSRLMILCHLLGGEKSVSDLERLLSARQAAVSQQLARLRLQGLVTARREGKAIYYSLADDRPARIIRTLREMYGKGSTDG